MLNGTVYCVHVGVYCTGREGVVVHVVVVKGWRGEGNMESGDFFSTYT